MFRTVLNADIGSANTRLGARNAVRTEKTCLCMERGGEFRIIAAGNEAAALRSGRLIYPVREGAAASAAMLAIFLKRMARSFTGKKNPAYTALHAALPGMTANIKRHSLKQALKLAGFRDFELHDSLLMGAVGAGMDIYSHTAQMLADIGSETTALAVICNGGLLFESVSATGSTAADRAIQRFFSERRGLLIGARAAEIIKMNLNRESFDVDGRSVCTGLPESAGVPAEEARKAAEGGLRGMLAAIIDGIKAIQEEAAADLLDNGITLIGGGARQFGLSGYFEKALGIPVRTAANAETAVIDGMNICMFEDKRLCREIAEGSGEPAAGVRTFAL